MYPRIHSIGSPCPSASTESPHTATSIVLGPHALLHRRNRIIAVVEFRHCRYAIDANITQCLSAWNRIFGLFIRNIIQATNWILLSKIRHSCQLLIPECSSSISKFKYHYGEFLTQLIVDSRCIFTWVIRLDIRYVILSNWMWNTACFILFRSKPSNLQGLFLHLLHRRFICWI